MSEWKHAEEYNGCSFQSFTKTVKVDGKPHQLYLEEVSKRWDLPYNWRVSILCECEKHPHEELIGQFYLKVGTNSADNAQAKAEELVNERAT